MSAWYVLALFAPAEAQPTVPPFGSSVLNSVQPFRMVALVTFFSSLVLNFTIQPGPNGGAGVPAGAVEESPGPFTSLRTSGASVRLEAGRAGFAVGAGARGGAPLAGG